jgi:hypothetical protein
MQVLTTASCLMGSGAASGECTREGGRAVAASGAKGGEWEAFGRNEAGHREAAANSCGGRHGGGQSRQANRTHQHASAHHSADASGWVVGGMGTVTSPFVRTSSRDSPNKGQGSRPGAS